MPEEITIPAAPEARNLRLDIWLAGALPGRSRARLQKLIRDGRVLVNGVPAKSDRKTRPGDLARITFPDAVPSALAAEPIPLNILYEDQHLLILNKPAGLVVHPAPGHPAHTLVNALLHHCPNLPGIGGERRPGIVHRLDKDTSGVMAVAKSELAAAGLTQQFAARTISKEYLALVWGRVRPATGMISTTIGRHPTDRKRMSARPRAGRAAVTDYAVAESFPLPLDLVRARPRTGRTHQIRVHLAWIGHPIAGDPKYGKRRRSALADAIPRLMLHAEKLALTHPADGRPLDFQAAIPDDMRKFLEQLRNAANA